MDYQVLFNIVLGAFSALVGWQMRNLYQSLKELSAADKELILKVSSLEVLVAGQYVTRSEFNNKIDAFFEKLDSIDTKLDARISSLRRP